MAPADASAEKALCQVCAASGSDHGPEEVVAESILDGVRYTFCAEDCKSAFDADPAAYLPPVLPRPAPAATFEGLDGADVALADFAGKVVLLDFWATWCKPCIKAMPDLRALHEQHGPRGFTVLGASIDDDAKKKVAAFLDKRKEKDRPSYPIVLDVKEPAAWEAFRVKVVPSGFLIDSEGQVVYQWAGKLDVAHVAALVDSLVAGTD
jgi:thiol-disulfide isomerase/thioredoxin